MSEEKVKETEEEKVDNVRPSKAGLTNSRGIPAALFIDNPYEIVYKYDVNQFLKDIENQLGMWQQSLSIKCAKNKTKHKQKIRTNKTPQKQKKKQKTKKKGKYSLMQRQLVKQKIGLKEKAKEMLTNIELVEYLSKKDKEIGDESMITHFELADQLYAKAKINDKKKVGLWLGANVMLEFELPEAKTFLEGKYKQAQDSIQVLQNDLDFCRSQINVLEVNRSRIYNANVKVKQTKESVKQK